jgi:catechol 2,3-dioxygenase-like lactoylglutathione lyase family enzyme
MGIQRATLGHVVLNVRNLKKSERFYRDILSMAVSGRNPRTKMSFLVGNRRGRTQQSKQSSMAGDSNHRS